MHHRASLALDELRAIIVLAEELNFHRAAHRLAISQPAVTRILARVEKHVGAKLFERSHSKRTSVVLTDAGRFYVERARLAVAHSDGAVIAARESHHGVTHRLAVGKCPCSDRQLVAILRSIQLPLYPKLSVHFETRYALELTSCVRAGELDLAVVTNPPDDVTLTYTVVRNCPFTAVMPAELRGRSSESIRLDEVADLPWILFERHIHPMLYDAFRERAADLGVGPDRIHHIADSEEACELALMLRGVAFLTPAGATRATEHFDDLVLRCLENDAIFLTTTLVTRADNASMLVSEFVRTTMRMLKATGLAPAQEPKPSVFPGSTRCAA